MAEATETAEAENLLASIVVKKDFDVDGIVAFFRHSGCFTPTTGNDAQNEEIFGFDEYLEGVVRPMLIFHKNKEDSQYMLVDISVHFYETTRVVLESSWYKQQKARFDSRFLDRAMKVSEGQLMPYDKLIPYKCDEKRLIIDAVYIIAAARRCPSLLQNIEGFRQTYPYVSCFVAENESTRLQHFMCWVRVVYTVYSLFQNENFFLTLIPRLSEGKRGLKYGTGTLVNAPSLARMIIIRGENPVKMNRRLSAQYTSLLLKCIDGRYDTSKLPAWMTIESSNKEQRVVSTMGGDSGGQSVPSGRKKRARMPTREIDLTDPPYKSVLAIPQIDLGAPVTIELPQGINTISKSKAAASAAVGASKGSVEGALGQLKEQQASAPISRSSSIASADRVNIESDSEDYDDAYAREVEAAALARISARKQYEDAYVNLLRTARYDDDLHQRGYLSTRLGTVPAEGSEVSDPDEGDRYAGSSSSRRSDEAQPKQLRRRLAEYPPHVYPDMPPYDDPTLYPHPYLYDEGGIYARTIAMAQAGLPLDNNMRYQDVSAYPYPPFPAYPPHAYPHGYPYHSHMYTHIHALPQGYLPAHDALYGARARHPIELDPRIALHDARQRQFSSENTTQPSQRRSQLAHAADERDTTHAQLHFDGTSARATVAQRQPESERDRNCGREHEQEGSDDIPVRTRLLPNGHRDVRVSTTNLESSIDMQHPNRRKA